MQRIINKWIENRQEVEKSYLTYITNKEIYSILKSPNIIDAHLEKCEYNMQFSSYLLKENKFIDWALIGLYYSIYHASLALLANKGFASKNHTATVCFIIKHYTEFSAEDIKVYNELALTKEEINFYTTLKSQRQQANYSTSTNFNKKHVEELRVKSINFIKKVEKILRG